MKLSIVIPIYNAGKYINRLLEPVLKSGFNDFEIICVNDGSKDNSLEVLRSIDDKRLRVFTKENEGTFKTWQYGVRQTVGDYITFFDQDDYIDGDYLPFIYRFINEINADVLQTPYRIHKLTGQTIEQRLPLEDGLYVDEKLEKARKFLTTGRTQYAKFTKVIRRELLFKQMENTVGNEVLDKVKDFEDWVTMIEVFKVADSLYIYNHCFYNYIQYPNSVSKSTISYRKNYGCFLAMMDYLESSKFSNLSQQELTSIGFFGSKVMLNKAIKIKEFSLAKEIMRSDFFSNGLKVADINKLLKIVFSLKSPHLYYLCYILCTNKLNN